MATEITSTSTVVVDDEPFIKGRAPPLASPFVTEAAPASTVKSAVLIFNPVGGTKKTQKLKDAVVLPMLKEAGVAVTCMPTQRAGHAEELAKTADLSAVDALIIMGGDGTLGEAVTGYMQRAQGAAACPLGFVPTGTGNTYCREALGVTVAGGKESGVRAAISAIIGGRVRMVDAAKLDFTGKDGSSQVTRYMINTVMAGFGPDANSVAEGRRWLGKARYDISIITELLKLPCRKPFPCTLTLDGKAMEMDDLFLLSIMNNKFTGTHHRIAPKAVLDDGLVDAIFTNKPLRSVGKAMKLDAAIKGGGKHCSDPLVSYERVKSAQLQTPQAARLMVDGDQVGFTPLNLTVVQGAFPLYTAESPGRT